MPTVTYRGVWGHASPKWISDALKLKLGLLGTQKLTLLTTHQSQCMKIHVEACAVCHVYAIMYVNWCEAAIGPWDAHHQIISRTTLWFIKRLNSLVRPYKRKYDSTVGAQCSPKFWLLSTPMQRNTLLLLNRLRSNFPRHTQTSHELCDLFKHPPEALLVKCVLLVYMFTP